MKRKKTSVSLIEADQIVATALERLFLKERTEIHHLPSDFAERPDDEMAYELNHSFGALIGSTENAEELVRRLRAGGCTVPIIVLIDHRCSQSTIQLLNAGADDVMVKPVNATEVLERMAVITRRTFGHQTTGIQIGEITAYFDGHDPEVDGKRIKLSHREHTIFTQLALRVGRVVSKETIYDAVYGMRDTQPFDKVVDVYICKLRKKLAAHTSGGCYIETVYGRGYKLDAPSAASLPDMAEDIIEEAEPKRAVG